MATNRKIVEMSDERMENGESVNELPVYTLSAVHADYDIVVDPNSMSPAFFTNLCKMAERTYKHIMSNEALATKTYKDAQAAQLDEDKLQTLLKTWRNARRELILNGELGFRESVPRVSEEDKQWRQDIIDILLKPRWKDSRPFPTSGKTMMPGNRTLNDWIDYLQSKQDYAYIKEQAYQTVADRKAKAAQTKASVVDKADAFADL